MRKIIPLLMMYVALSASSSTPLYQINFNSGLDDKWRTLSALGDYTPGVERVKSLSGLWDKRLRLTDRKHDLSAAVTLDYEFPTKNNKFILEFDYFAYGGCEDNKNSINWDTKAGKWGADGMAVILFDSSAGQTPTVGASGGSLGYANGNIELTDGSFKEQAGFEKGWIAIGLDEFGAFSSNCEARRDIDGDETPNSIVIRGDAENGYRLLQTKQLSKSLARWSVKKNGTLRQYANKDYYSGTYRITIDSTQDGHLYIKVERKTKKNGSFRVVVPRFDAMKEQYHQGKKPEKFRLAFSSGTGGGCNIHEIDNVKIYSKGSEYTPTHGKPFECSMNSYLFGSDTDAAYANAYNMNLTNGSIEMVQRIEGSHINATGYNIKDNFIYGYEYGNTSMNFFKNIKENKIPWDCMQQGKFPWECLSNDGFYVVRIDADFHKERFKIDGLPDDYYYLGDVSFDGIYYLAKRQKESSSFCQSIPWMHDHNDVNQFKKDISNMFNRKNNNDVLLEIQRVDVSTMKLQPKLVLNYPTGVAKIVSADFAFNPKDHKLYTINATNNSLYRIDPDSGDVENLGFVGVRNTYSVISFFDNNGYFYFYKNDNKKVYRIDISNPDNINPQAKVFSDISAEMITSGDGARCPLAEVEEPAVTSKPFTCSQDAYLFNMRNPSQVHTINLTDGTTQSADDIPSRFINGTGYNVKDNMIWGYDIDNNKVIKIDADYNVTDFTVTELPEGKYYAGDVSQEGILYLKKHNDSHLYKLDLNSGTPVYLGTVVLKEGDAISEANFGDFAFSPKDKMLYGISEKDGDTYNHLYRIDPQDGQVTDLGVANPGVAVEYHTFVFDVDGNLYFYGKTGKIYRIKIAEGKYKAEFFAQTDLKSAGGDGARCPNAKVDEPVDRNGVCYAIDDTQDKLYSVYMKPGASTLPVAENIPLDFSGVNRSLRKSLNGEGGAYNSADGLIYVFHQSTYPTLYSVNPENGKVAYVTKFEDMKYNVVGASFYGGYFYVIAKSRDGGAVLYKIVPSDWSIAETKSLDGATSDADALAINTKGEAYIITDNDKRIYKIDLDTARTTYVTRISTNSDAEGLSFALDGNLYVENSEENHRDTDQLFKINLATGSLTPAAQIPPEDNIDIEALSCNTYAATSDDEQKLFISDVKDTEGNSGQKDFSFKVHFSKPAEEGMGFWYTVTDGSDGDESEYPGAYLDDRDMVGISGCVEVSKTGGSRDIYGSHADSCVKIPEGSVYAVLHVRVNGDTKIEADERFFVDIYAPDNATIEDGRAEGIVLNDDANISVNAMTSGSGFDGNITTQVVGRPFSLQIKAYDMTNKIFVPDVNITRVRILNNDGISVYSWTGRLVTDVSGTATLENIVVHQAVKVASVKIDANYNGNTYENIVATDKFAIRPDRFMIEIPSENVAGEAFTLSLKAVSAGVSATAVVNYNEEINTSFSVGFAEQLAHCKTGSIDLSGITFANGTATKNIKYTEVGKLDFNITEIKGQEFAYVDANDTPDAQRLITEASVNDVVFKPAKAVVEWSLKDGDELNNYTYFGNFDAYTDAYNMAASLNLSISMLNAMGDVVENFSQECYADDVSVNLHYRLEGEKDIEYIMHTEYMDMNGTVREDVSALPVKLSMEGAFDAVDSVENVATNFMNFLPSTNMMPFSSGDGDSDPSTATPASVTEPTSEGVYTGYKLDGKLFEGGVGVKMAKFNFERKVNEPRNPMKFKVLDLNVSFESIPTEVTLTGSNEVTFLYARAHIPDQEIVGEKGDINVFYEVYCKECDLSKYGLASLQESKDSIYWYILDSVNETYSDYAVPSDYNDIVTPAPGDIISSHTTSLKDVSHVNNTKMHIEVNKSPTVARIKYKPKSYLIFNRFNASADRQAFTASFSHNRKSWAGRGKLGKTIDTTISPRNNIDIIDW